MNVHMYIILCVHGQQNGSRTVLDISSASRAASPAGGAY